VRLAWAEPGYKKEHRIFFVVEEHEDKEES
jgi:hypothetical protein